MASNRFQFLQSLSISVGMAFATSCFAMLAGIAGMGMYALKLYYDTEESREGVNALKEKRKPEFRKYAK